MTLPHLVSTLEAKRAATERLIIDYEKRIEAAKRDLVHIGCTIALFERDGSSEPLNLEASVWSRGAHGSA
jgi:hypothetical protein